MKKVFLIELKEQNERVYFQKDRFVIFDDNEIHLKIFQLTHDSLNAKHFNKIK